jgi:hypothetical protein
MAGRVLSIAVEARRRMWRKLWPVASAHLAPGELVTPDDYPTAACRGLCHAIGDEHSQRVVVQQIARDYQIGLRESWRSLGALRSVWARRVEFRGGVQAPGAAPSTELKSSTRPST